MKKAIQRFISMMCSLVVVLGCMVIQPDAHTVRDSGDADSSDYEEVAGIEYEGHTYSLYDVGLTWFEAKEYCEKQGGHLVTITSAQEQKCVEELLEFGQKKQYWMGMTLASGSRNWITGEPCSYSNWDRGEPDEKTRKDGQHEYYVHIYNTANPAVSGSRRFKWNDMYFDNTFPGEEDNFSTTHCGFICEWENDDVYFAQIKYCNKTYNLLSQTINIMEGSDIETAVKVNYKDGNGKEKIYITQNTANAIELKNKKEVTIQPGKAFEPDKEIYILIVNEETGEAFSKCTALKIVNKTASGELLPDSGVNGLNFKLGKDTSFTIPDFIPVFNGTEIKWEFDFIPVSVEYDKEDHNKINVVFGTNLLKYQDKETGLEFFTDFDFAAYKKAVSKATSKQKRSLKQLRNDFDMTNAQTMNLFGGKVLGGGTGESSTDLDVAGYAEMKIIDGKLRFIEGQLCLNVEASYTYHGQLFIWVVPICYEIGGGIGAGLEGDMINLSPETFIPEFEAYLTAEINAKLGAGVGVSKVASVGVSGDGALKLKSALDTDYLKVWGEGSADFNVKLFSKIVAKKEFAKGDFLIYETGNSNGLLNDNEVNLTSVEDGVYARINKNQVYENESRDYLNAPSEWYGNTPSVGMLSAENTNENLQILAENVYTESAPILCEVDGQKIMVMLWDDAERADIDKTMLVWSVFNERTQTWSQPQPVSDDHTADYYPSFKDGWVVWQNQKTVMNASMTLEQIAALGEINAAKWNGSGFDTPIAITDNDTMDTLPVVCADGDEVTVAWVTNTENDILGLEGRNTIKKAVYTDSWSEVQDMQANLNAVTGLSAGYVGGSAVVAYSVDTDNDLQTVNDWEIYLINRANVRLTDNKVLDSSPVFVGNQLYYFSDNNIIRYDLENNQKTAVFENAQPELSDAFSVASNKSKQTAIWWSSPVEGGTELFCALETDGVWSERVQITDMGNQSRYPSGLLEEDGSFYLAFCNSIWQDGDIVQNDLCTLQLVPSHDLMVENAYLDETTMTVYATVRNDGELPVDSYTISLSDTNLNNQETFTTPLKAGASTEVALAYNIPDNMNKREITFSVASNHAEDRDPSNNSSAFVVGNSDIEITDVVVHEGIPKSSAMVTVSNIGYTNSGKVTICLREQRKDGNIIATEVVRDLSAGEKTVITLEYDVTQYEDVLWYVTATAVNEESTSVNNDAYFVNTCMVNQTQYTGTLLQCRMSGDNMTVYASVQNNTSVEASANVMAAVYQEDGRLKAIKTLPVTILPYDSTTLGLQFENYVYEEGEYVKLFCMDGENKWVPITEATSAAVCIQE